MATLPALAATIVLVHGGFVDGAGWEGVYSILKKDGYDVSIVQNPTTSLADDVAVTRRTIAQAKGPVVLVGHSYGGVVVTEAGNDPKVAGVVYIAAFAPDKGESVDSLIKNPPPGASVPPILPPVDGYLFLDRAKFRASFAADVDEAKAAFMADSQVPWSVNALTGAVSEPAWKTKPSWYLVATDDKMIPPPAQRQMSKRAGSSTVEIKGSHAIYVSQPKPVAALIEKAAREARNCRQTELREHRRRKPRPTAVLQCDEFTTLMFEGWCDREPDIRPLHHTNCILNSRPTSLEGWAAHASRRACGHAPNQTCRSPGARL